MRKSIIDIGTNTFNLLVFEVDDNKKLNILYEEKLPVKLGKGSLKDGILKPDAIERGIKAIGKHIETSEKYRVGKIEAFATSAVRSAVNKDAFVNRVLQEFDIEFNIISGDEEAGLIYKGIKHAVKLEPGINYLVLDIGGGSNEFILCNSEGILWKESYNLGVARLLELVNPHDPIKNDNIKQVVKLSEELIFNLDEKCKEYNPSVLIGASGSFETYLSMILFEKYGTDELLKQNTSLEIIPEDFYKLHDKLVMSTANKRKDMKGLPEWRIDMIVLAAVFTKFIIERYNLKRILFSGYALKEGVAFGLTNDD